MNSSRICSDPLMKAMRAPGRAAEESDLAEARPTQHVFESAGRGSGVTTTEVSVVQHHV